MRVFKVEDGLHERISPTSSYSPDTQPDPESKSFSSLLTSNEFLVDSGEEIIHSNGYIQGYNSGPLHSGDTINTEVEKRIATALLAFQVLNPRPGSELLPLLTHAQLQNQKTLTGGHMIGLPVPGKSDTVHHGDMDQTPSYNQQMAVKNEDSSNSMHILPPLKKALSRSRYPGRDPNESIPLESLGLGLHTEMAAMDVKRDPIEFILPSQHEETELLDESEQNRRNSLPHKKRIQRRLRAPKKPVLTRCSPVLRPSSYPAPAPAPVPPPAHFVCQLCFLSYDDQWKFFEHLKTHYEAPPVTQAETEPPISQVPSSEVERDRPRLLYTRLTQSMESGSCERQAVMHHETPPRESVYDIVQPKPSDEEWIAEHHETLVDGYYYCTVCDKAFRKAKALEAHLAIHDGETVVQVEEFSDTEDMMEGIRVNVANEEGDVLQIGGSNRVWCNEADIAEYIGGGELRGNLQIAEELNTLAVHETELHEPQESLVIEETTEENTCEPAEDRSCEVCKEVFASKELAKQHFVQTHTTPPALTKKPTPSNRSPAKKKASRKKMALECTFCGRVFAHRNSLQYHIKGHYGAKEFECEVCKVSFYSKGALSVHLRRHSGAKPYMCPTCSRPFRQAGDLKYHIISIHTDQRNYQCEVCGKDFARKYSLTVHSRIHTGERNYKCEFCDKSFRASHYLLNHRRIHTGEKPYKCPICARDFRMRSDMRRHQITHKSPAKERPARKSPKLEIEDEKKNVFKLEKVEEVDGAMYIQWPAISL